PSSSPARRSRRVAVGTTLRLTIAAMPDEGSVTVTQMQGLRAARDAGIAVPRSILDKAMKYLENSTTDNGGVVYSLAQGSRAGGARPALTAATVACASTPATISRRWRKNGSDSVKL